MKYKMTARARVNPTEDSDKVITAISNIFKFDELEIGDGYVKVTGDMESLLDFCVNHSKIGRYVTQHREYF